MVLRSLKFEYLQYSGNNIIYDNQMPLIVCVFTLVLLFIIFFIGQTIQSNAMSLSNVVYHSEWYRYPNIIRRAFPLILMRSQQPFCPSAYGIIELQLVNFVQVSNFIIRNKFIIVQRIGQMLQFLAFSSFEYASIRTLLHSTHG